MHMAEILVAFDPLFPVFFYNSIPRRGVLQRAVPERRRKIRYESVFR
jgi:hypothetical protein